MSSRKSNSSEPPKEQPEKQNRGYTQNIQAGNNVYVFNADVNIYQYFDGQGKEQASTVIRAENGSPNQNGQVVPKSMKSKTQVPIRSASLTSITSLSPKSSLDDAFRSTKYKNAIFRDRDESLKTNEPNMIKQMTTGKELSASSKLSSPISSTSWAFPPLETILKIQEDAIPNRPISSELVKQMSTYKELSTTSKLSSSISSTSGASPPIETILKIQDKQSAPNPPISSELVKQITTDKELSTTSKLSSSISSTSGASPPIETILKIQDKQSAPNPPISSELVKQITTDKELSTTSKLSSSISSTSGASPPIETILKIQDKQSAPNRPISSELVKQMSTYKELSTTSKLSSSISSTSGAFPPLDTVKNSMPVSAQLEPTSSTMAKMSSTAKIGAISKDTRGPFLPMAKEKFTKKSSKD